LGFGSYEIIYIFRHGSPILPASHLQRRHKPTSRVAGARRTISRSLIECTLHKGCGFTSRPSPIQSHISQLPPLRGWTAPALSTPLQDLRRRSASAQRSCYLRRANEVSDEELKLEFERLSPGAAANVVGPPDKFIHSEYYRYRR